MGILYSEGARRYLDSLAAYTRRRISQVGRAQVDEVKHIPSALALRQRPAVPGVRSTVGTVTEIFNIIRLIFSRLGSPVCPNGHRVPPTIKIAEAMDLTGEAMGRLTCPTCGVQFYAFSAEDFAFNSDGACQKCQGLGTVEQIDDSKIIADENLSLEKGAVATWQIPGRNWMWRIARELGVRTDIPKSPLTCQLQLVGFIILMRYMRMPIMQWLTPVKLQSRSEGCKELILFINLVPVLAAMAIGLILVAGSN